MFFPYRDENPARSLPFLTIALIAYQVWLFIWNGGTGTVVQVANAYGFSPNLMLEKPWVMFTSLFLHGGWLHLVSNMWFLWLFGDNIEDRFGRIPFLLLFIISGVVGNFTHSALSGLNDEIPVIGASGSVAGIMGAYVVRFSSARIRCVLLLGFYPILMRIPSFWFIGSWMLIEFLAAYISPGDYVAHWAHVGGFLFGVTWALGRRDKRIRSSFRR